MLHFTAANLTNLTFLEQSVYLSNFWPLYYCTYDDFHLIGLPFLPLPAPTAACHFHPQSHLKTTSCMMPFLPLIRIFPLSFIPIWYSVKLYSFKNLFSYSDHISWSVFKFQLRWKMIIVKLQDIKSTHKNPLHSYTLIMRK